ncbi:MAG: hypothetical protein JNN08_19125 [Bryobacterales bacterium]|nr:hypothetical protein [Bryobacterales bacterium]
MPYCTQCGQQVTAAARFCGACGTAQQTATATGTFLDRIEPRTASILCYVPILGWVACIIILASQRFRADRETRFHASQGLYLFVAWLILDWGLQPFLAVLPLPSFYSSVYKGLKLILIGASVFMIVKTSQGERYSLPVFGELAEKSVAEQR